MQSWSRAFSNSRFSNNASNPDFLFVLGRMHDKSLLDTVAACLQAHLAWQRSICGSDSGACLMYAPIRTLRIPQDKWRASTTAARTRSGQVLPNDPSLTCSRLVIGRPIAMAENCLRH